MKSTKLLERLRAGQVQGVEFSDLCQLLLKLGFRFRQKGGHRIFSREGMPEIVNLQPKGKEAKAYQVRQVLEIIERYGFTL